MKMQLSKETGKIISYGICVMIILALGLQLLNSMPIKCYLEQGKIERQWESDNFFFINFINRNGTQKDIWFSDNYPIQLNDPKEAIHDYGMDLSKEDVVLRWCYIPSINKTRIRGAWKW